MKRIVVIALAIAMFTTMVVSAADWSWLPGGIDSTVSEYSPYIRTIKKIWDKQSLEKLIEGKFAVPDETINVAIAEQIKDDPRVKSLSITSKKNGRLEIHADIKKYGGVELSGTIDKFVHDGDTSYMTYRVKDKDLKNYGGITGWMFSHLSLSMMERFVGRIELSDKLPTKIKGNSITIDYSAILKNSALAQQTVYGYNLLDALRIDGAVPHEGYIEFQTALNVPDKVKSLLLNVLD